MKTILSGVVIYKCSWFEINQDLIETAVVVVAFIALVAAFNYMQERWLNR